MPLNKKKVLEYAKGFRGRGKNIITVARRKVDRALAHATRDRKNKHRLFRSDWITNINAAVREHGMRYNSFMWGLELSNIKLDRKSLSELSKNEPYSFQAVVEQVKRVMFKEAPPKSSQMKELLKTTRSFEKQLTSTKALADKRRSETKPTSTMDKID